MGFYSIYRLDENPITTSQIESTTSPDLTTGPSSALTSASQTTTSSNSSIITTTSDIEKSSIQPSTNRLVPIIAGAAGGFGNYSLSVDS
jgi:hypothetical protein